MLALCESCRALARRLFEPSRPQWLSTHVGNVQAGAANNCLLCWGLMQRMKVSEAEMDRKASNLWVHWTTGSWDDSNTEEKPRVNGGISVLYVMVTASPDPSLSAKAKFTCLYSVDAEEGSPAASSGAVNGRYTNPRASVEDATTRIKAWVDSCQSHEHCRLTLSRTRPIDPRRAPLPKRCVRVEERSDGTLSLTLEETGGQIGSYIILTHRWNSPQTEQSMTVKSNYAARIMGQEFDNLDPLFDDVLLVASRVGIRHVWIDSICIVQNDGADWREEAVKMADYYQNALFTIAAAIPTASRADGLFLPMPPPEEQQLVQLPFPGGGHFYIYPHPNEGSAMQRYRRVIRGSELASRGWVYQERMLSRRIAWFTPVGLSLQCICKLSDWESPDFRPKAPGIDLSWLNPMALFRRPERQVASARTTEDVYTDWRGSIRDYSTLSLTKTSDRILALSGVGREYGDWLRASSGSSSPVRLIAGVWDGDLHQSLLWAAAEVGKPRIGAYPTWSWASYEGSTHWPYETKTRPDCTFEQIIPCQPDEARLIEKSGPTYRIPGQQTDTTDDDIISFAAMVVRGRLQPVHFGTHFPDKDTANTVLIAGGQGSRYSAPADRWLRMASVATAPDIVAGWAMFEDATLQEDAAFVGPAAPKIMALRISVVEGLDNGSLAVGHFWSHEAFNVVYLRPSGQVVNGFERVGVGRLFGQDAKGGFGTAEETEIVLV